MNSSKLLLSIINETLTPEEVWAELQKLSKGHIRQARRYSPKKVIIFRTRSYAENIRPAFMHELTYPPVSKAKLQRANSIGEQIFYASAGLPTTLAESQVVAGQYIIVSRWVNTREMLLQELGFTTRSSGLDKLYHDVFTNRDKSLYKYTSIIAKHLMKGEVVDGLIYQSVANQNMSHNLAIKKEFVDKGLQFVDATCYLVKTISNDYKYDVEQIDFATSSGKRLDWKGRIKHWTISKPGDELRFISNGWDLDAYKSDGTYVNPE